MLPYFLNLNKRFISDDLAKTILTLAEKNKKHFIHYRMQSTGLPDGNAYLTLRAPFTIPGIEKIKSSCSLELLPLVMMHVPNVVVDKHIDDPNKRNCLLITPLSPKENYVPVHFWEEDGLEPAATCEFEKFNSAIINTQVLHELTNGNEYRFNLQFCFNESFDEVIDLYQKGILFKN